jgi:hypothetical protein
LKAFPCEQKQINPFTDNLMTVNHTGMDLRDYFAAKAMQYWLSNPIDNRQIEKLCEGAYQIADAMMKARKQ